MTVARVNTNFINATTRQVQQLLHNKILSSHDHGKPSPPFSEHRNKYTTQIKTFREAKLLDLVIDEIALSLCCCILSVVNITGLAVV